MRRRLPSAPRSAASAFDEYLREWLNFTGVKLSAPSLSRLLEAADNGDAAEQAAFFQSVLEKEPVIAAHIQTRILAVLCSDWRIVGPDEAKNREMQDILSKAGLRSLLRHLLDALVTGYAGSAIIWSEDGSSVESFRHVHPTNWSFDPEGHPSLISAKGQSKALRDYHPKQFIFHTHLLKPGLPSRGGLLRPLAWLYFFKHYALRDRARYLERFGMPFLLATISRDDFNSDEARSNILASLSKIGSDGVGVLTEGSQVETLNASAGGAGDNYQQWLSYIDDVCALTILGQLASSKQASGLSKGQMQENVRQDILEADCRNLMDSVNSQLVSPLERFRYGSEGSMSFSISFEQPEDLKQRAEILKILTESGFAADLSWISKSFGIPEKSSLTNLENVQ